MPDPIERLTVELEADIRKLVSGTKEGVKASEDELKKVDRAAKKSFDDAGKSAKGFGAIMTGAVAGGVSAVTTALLNMAVRGAQALLDLGQRALGLQSDLESARITFTSMFKGNEQAATAFIGHLKDVSRQLKINQVDAQRFAKSILPDTSSVAQFDELLRLAAVASRDTKKSVEELIFTFNEAVAGDFTSMRDILDLPPDVRDRLNAAKGDVGVLIEELNKLFAKRGINDLGAFSGTLDATTGSLKAFGDDLLLIASGPGFETLKEAAERLLSVLEENKPELQAVAAAVGEVADSALRFLSTNLIDAIENFDGSAAQAIFSSVADGIDRFQLLIDTLGGVQLSFGEIYETIVEINPLLLGLGFSGDFLDDLEMINDRLNRALVTAVQLASLAKAEAARAKAEADAAAEAIGADRIVPGMRQGVIGTLSEEQQTQVQAAGDAAYNAELMKGAQAVEEFNTKLEERAKRQEKATETTKSDKDALQQVNDILAENADKASAADEAAAKLLDKYGDELLDLQEKVNEEAEQAAAEHGEVMLQIEQEAADERKKAQAELTEDLAELEKDIAKERSEIISGASEDLRKLAQETDQKLEDEREEFEQEEKRATEDHLKDMRRLREQYLFDLEDAAKARDARAIVDLRRRFEQESGVREEDFDTQQSRGREDQDRQLQQIREEERRRADEITLAREEELRQLIEKEAEKRAQIQTSYDEQIASINAKEEEKRQAEIVKYEEQQAELEASLTRRLEAIAKELADEKDINEEGAAKILETLAEYFGEEGEIDKLMADFRERMDTKMKLQVEFDSSAGSEETPESSPGRTVGSGQPRAFASGGAMIARAPTTALFGEREPELAVFVPLSMMNGASVMNAQAATAGAQAMTARAGAGGETVHRIEFSGAAPPGIRAAERDQIAGVVVQALRDAGVNARPGR